MSKIYIKHVGKEYTVATTINMKIDKIEVYIVVVKKIEFAL